MNKFSNNIVKLQTIDSTNEEAFRRAASFNSQRLAVSSEMQTAGRGRMGRSFLSEKSQGLFLSLLESEVIEPQLTARVSVCICRCLRELSGLDCKIKWPNDILVDGKKICGILCEMRAGSVVIGIGINLYNNSFGELDSIATSFFMHGISINKELLLHAILDQMDHLLDNYDTLKEQDLAYYREFSSISGKNIYIYENNEKVPAKAIGFDENFALIIQEKSGSTRAISSGEISLRLQNE